VKNKKLLYVIIVIILVGVVGFLFFQLISVPRPENTKSSIFEQYLANLRKPRKSSALDSVSQVKPSL